MIEFKILKKSKRSQARIGILKTPHGEIETPSFVPVATQAAVKTLPSELVEETKTQIIIANTFHLHLKPGEKFVKKAGGIHKFMNWHHPVMTDSGGFQVFSLGFGQEYGTGKILKTKRAAVIKKDTKPKHIKITGDGVYFTSPIDGRKIFLGPKESIKIQEALGADIIFAFDECPSPLATRDYLKDSLKLTHKWAKLCIQHKKSNQALYGIVQGGKYKNLRQESARVIGKMNFAGFGYGGEFGNDKKSMANIINWVNKILPVAKPRHLLGIGHPEDILPIIKSGVDTFDCIAPTHYARHGTAFTSEGRLDMKKSRFLKDGGALDKKCGCFVCGSYSRMYISHLMRASEITGMELLTFHNLYFFNTLVENIRNKIKSDII